MRQTLSSIPQLALMVLLTPAGLASYLNVPNGVAQRPPDSYKTPDLKIGEKTTVGDCLDELDKLEEEWKVDAHVALPAIGYDRSAKVTSQYPPAGVDAPISRSIFLRVNTSGAPTPFQHWLVVLVTSALAIVGFTWAFYLKRQMRVNQQGVKHPQPPPSAQSDPGQRGSQS